MAEQKPTRVCRKCHTAKPVTEFTKNPRGGPTRECKVCAYARARVWAENNRDKDKAIKDRYRQSHPDRDRQSKRDHYERNRAVIIERSRIHKEVNRAAINARYRSQYSEDRAPFLRRQNLRYLRDRMVGGTFTRTDVLRLFVAQGGVCANPKLPCRLNSGEVSR
jgi:hypothetical protein